MVTTAALIGKLTQELKRHTKQDKYSRHAVSWLEQANRYYTEALDAGDEPAATGAYERATVLLEDTRRLLEHVTIATDQPTGALTHAFFIDFVKLVGHSMQDDVRIKAQGLREQTNKAG